MISISFEASARVHSEVLKSSRNTAVDNIRISHYHLVKGLGKPMHQQGPNIEVRL